MENSLYNDKISQGITLMSTEKYDAAKKYFQEAIEIQPTEAEAYNHLGNAYVNLEMYEEAIESFQKMLLIDSENSEIYFSIGSVYVLMGQLEKAVEFFNKAENKGYESSQMYQILASIFFEEDDEVQALRYITRAIKISPFDGSLRILKVKIYLANNQYEQALETLDEMEKVLPDAFEVYDLKAQIYSGMENYEEALKIVEAGVKRFPDDVNLMITKLKVLVLSNKDSQAKELIQTMKEKGVYKIVLKEASIHEATIYIKEQKIDEAHKILFEAKEVLNNDADILYLLLDLCGKTGKYSDVLKYSDELMKVECGDMYLSTAMFFHATALDELGQKETALSEYKSLTKKLRKMTINNPAFYEGYLYRLLSHTKLGEYDKALNLAEYIENLYPEQSDAHAFRYFIYKEMGEEKLAEKERLTAKTLNPNLEIN